MTTPLERTSDPTVPGTRGFSVKALASLAVGGLYPFAWLGGLAAVLLGWRALWEINTGKRRLVGRWMAVTGIVLGAINCLGPLLMLDGLRGVEGGVCKGRLRQIGLALHNYEQAYGCLPPAASVDSTGEPLLSWRVLILPYMGQQDLYARFRLDEPWDSPHNLKALDSMPTAFACPGGTSEDSGMTGYQAVVGPWTVFPPDFRPVALSEVTDGAGATLAVVESLHPVPWTKPHDLHDDDAFVVYGLDYLHGSEDGGFNALLVDGSVRFFRLSLATGVLRALARRGDGEAVSPDDNAHPHSPITTPPREEPTHEASLWTRGRAEFQGAGSAADQR